MTSKYVTEGDGQGYPGEMTGKITIMAKPPLFKCLMGANGENFRKIKRECEANIHVEGETSVRDHSKGLWNLNSSEECRWSSTRLHFWFCY